MATIDFSKTDVIQIQQILGGCITPRPIAWISTISADGISNLAPFSYFTVASNAPPVFSVTHVRNRMEKDKDTLANLKVTKECVVNLVDEQLISAAVLTSGDFSSDIDEFEQASIAKIESKLVKPFGVKDSLFRFECVLRDIIELGKGPASGTIILLDILCVHIDDVYINENGMVKADMVHTIGKMGKMPFGDFYTKANADMSIDRIKV